MNNSIQLVLLELKRQKKETFPDHICAQANRVMRYAGNICHNTDALKYDKLSEHTPYLKASLISTMAVCLRMLEEIEK